MFRKRPQIAVGSSRGRTRRAPADGQTTERAASEHSRTSRRITPVAETTANERRRRRRQRCVYSDVTSEPLIIDIDDVIGASRHMLKRNRMERSDDVLSVSLYEKHARTRVRVARSADVMMHVDLHLVVQTVTKVQEIVHGDQQRCRPSRPWPPSKLLSMFFYFYMLTMAARRKSLRGCFLQMTFRCSRFCLRRWRMFNLSIFFNDHQRVRRLSLSPSHSSFLCASEGGVGDQPIAHVCASRSALPIRFLVER